jgi:hypothetical protein
VFNIPEETWISGPLELLEHAAQHIKEGKEFDLIIALISIDNAVEIAIKIYFTINRRTLGLNRKKFKNAKQHFPSLLDLLWEYAPDKTSEGNLDAIEYYHKIRNNLYHDPVGIITKVKIVELYFTLADNLISELFDIREEEHKEYILSDINEKFKEFLEIWDKIRTNLNNFTLTKGLVPTITKPYTISKILSTLVKNKKIQKDFANNIFTMFEIRNQIMHNKRDFNLEDLDKIIKELEEIDEELINIMNK